MFIVALLGTIFAVVLAQQTNARTHLTAITETVSLTPAIINGTYYNQTPLSLSSNTLQSGFRLDYSECEVTSLISVKNYTGTEKTTPAKYNFTKANGTTPAYITLTTGVTQDTAKDWISGTSNTSTVTYNRCADDYTGSWSKTVLDLVPGLYVIAIMILAAIVIIVIMRKEGINT